MAPKEIHVVMRDRRWAVVRPGSDRMESTHDRKSDAVRAGREIAQREEAELIVFSLDERRQGETGEIVPS